MSLSDFSSVLLIDDDYISTFLMDEILREYGMIESIYIAHTGEEALTLLERIKNFEPRNPDLIFLDFNLPDMAGLDFLEAYSKIDYLKGKIKIIMISSKFRETDVEKAKIYTDVVGFIEKPINLERLNKVLR